jgi:hypothetical protein
MACLDHLRLHGRQRSGKDEGGAEEEGGIAQQICESLPPVCGRLSFCTSASPTNHKFELAECWDEAYFLLQLLSFCPGGNVYGSQRKCGVNAALVQRSME